MFFIGMGFADKSGRESTLSGHVAWKQKNGFAMEKGLHFAFAWIKSAQFFSFEWPLQRHFQQLPIGRGA